MAALAHWGGDDIDEPIDPLARQLALLPPVFLLGVFSYLRLVQTSIEDMVYAVGVFRIRQYFMGLDPAAMPFFPPPTRWA